MLREAEAAGWRVELSRGGRAHPWGRMLCPYGARGGCRPSVYSTPSNVRRHVAALRSALNRCPHAGNRGT